MEVTRYDPLNHCRECGKLGPHLIILGDTRFWLCQWCAVELSTKLGDAIAAELNKVAVHTGGQ